MDYPNPYLKILQKFLIYLKCYYSTCYKNVLRFIPKLENHVLIIRVYDSDFDKETNEPIKNQTFSDIRPLTFNTCIKCFRGGA